ncbi:hypothetical protein GCM10011321_10760 [Youhaiella tibetensis]|uniref:Uncharacterized protein n=1 Tax=Paradevosia tibetensis TaxID=1447062 RepID=A0A5B9DPC8_9HYPH|nr:hypothetical protein [Youhaiella tibetensis]AKR55642.1 hypothetical protein XM25_07470 [Devosia sp. H5989]QEE20775.1 hypothetical protein FNA67_11585 [Youhaiella tibetensis]GGF21096.1 hypothetical protein GCM10011321_10760 [Youhaiella tibetensis]
MAQQSTTEPRKAPKRQGPKTRAQAHRIVTGAENTAGADVPLPGETLKHANLRYPKPGPGDAYNISTGDRSIKRGANQETEHHKQRADES